MQPKKAAQSTQQRTAKFSSTPFSQNTSSLMSLVKARYTFKTQVGMAQQYYSVRIEVFELIRPAIMGSLPV
jgi:hypothetical protein